MRLEHLDTGQRIMEAMGAITFPKPGIGINPVRLPGVQFQASGVYHFVMEVEGQTEPIMHEFSVALNLQPGTLQPGQLPPGFPGMNR